LRPTLEEQIEVQKKISTMTDEELIGVLMGYRCRLQGRIDLALFTHCKVLWSIIHWNWYCPWCGRSHFRIRDDACLRKRRARD